MYLWLRHIVVLLIALGLYYVVAYLVVVTTIRSPAISAAIIASGSTPAEQVAASFQALFPVPIFLVIIGIVLSKWVQF
nr:hypothetical protein [Candidatus Njordarchaeum guaymaensis]